MKQIMKLLLGKPLTVTVSNLAPDLQTINRWKYPNIIGKVTDKEVEECVQLIRQNLGHAYLSPTDRELREHCLKQIRPDGLILEFGVFRAKSTNLMADFLLSRRDARTLHGFDSFEGLSHDGAGWLWHKGRFNLDGKMPEVRKNVKLHKGWIDDTLPKFLEEHPNEPISFIHIDVDIYEPAKTILTLCKSRLRPGSIIVFDELLGFAGWKFHEYKALNEVFSTDEYEYIGFSDYFQAAIRIL